MVTALGMFDREIQINVYCHKEIVIVYGGLSCEHPVSINERIEALNT